MSTLRDVLRPFWLSGVNECSSGRNQSFKGWLGDQQYVVSAFDAVTKEVALSSTDTRTIVSAFAHDIDRFGAATLETIAGITFNSEFAASRAWPLIRAYYAAFYSAHGLCRMFGRSVSNMDTNYADAIRRVAVGSGLGEVVKINDNSMYVFHFDPPNNVVTGLPLTKGSHEETWRQFERLLSDLQSLVLTGPGLISDKQEVFNFLNSIRDILNADESRANWLSKVRNNLNYRQDYGAWFPHGSGKHWTDVDALFRSFLADPIATKAAGELKPIVRFTKGCALIVSLFCEVLRDVAQRHSTNESFLLDRTIPISRGSSRTRVQIRG
jgi:hypothetical protein